MKALLLSSILATCPAMWNTIIYKYGAKVCCHQIDVIAVDTIIYGEEKLLKIHIVHLKEYG